MQVRRNDVMGFLRRRRRGFAFAVTEYSVQPYCGMVGTDPCLDAMHLAVLPREASLHLALFLI